MKILRTARLGFNFTVSYKKECRALSEYDTKFLRVVILFEYKKSVSHYYYCYYYYYQFILCWQDLKFYN